MKSQICLACLVGWTLGFVLVFKPCHFRLRSSRLTVKIYKENHPSTELPKIGGHLSLWLEEANSDWPVELTSHKKWSTYVRSMRGKTWKNRQKGFLIGVLGVFFFFFSVKFSLCYSPLLKSWTHKHIAIVISLLVGSPKKYSLLGFCVAKSRQTSPTSNNNSFFLGFLKLGTLNPKP